MNVEPIEQHAAPQSIVFGALALSWFAGAEFAAWLGLEGTLSWIVTGVTCVAGYFTIGIAYGIAYQAVGSSSGGYAVAEYRRLAGRLCGNLVR